MARKFEMISPLYWFRNAPYTFTACMIFAALVGWVLAIWFPLQSPLKTRDFPKDFTMEDCEPGTLRALDGEYVGLGGWTCMYGGGTRHE